MVNFHLPLCHCHQRHQVHMEMRHAGCKTCTSRLPACTKMHNLCQIPIDKFQCANERGAATVSDTHPPTH